MFSFVFSLIISLLLSLTRKGTLIITLGSKYLNSLSSLILDPDLVDPPARHFTPLPQPSHIAHRKLRQRTSVHRIAPQFI